jgi:hypothetical protein
VTPPPDVARVVLVVAAGLAWLLVRRAPQHRPAAVALSALAAIDVTRRLLYPRLPPVGNSLFLAFYAVEAGVALRVFAGRRPWPAAAGWALAVGAMLRWWDERQTVMLGAFLAALACTASAGVVWLRRRAGALPGPQHGVAVLLFLSSAMDIFGPWLTGHPIGDWPNGAWTSLLTWIMISAWEAWRWRVLRYVDG